MLYDYGSCDLEKYIDRDNVTTAHLGMGYLKLGGESQMSTKLVEILLVEIHSRSLFSHI